MYQDEEPLDDCQAEIDRILAKFPNGYQIDPDEWEYADEPGIIEALFIPYVEPALDDYDLFVDDPYGTGDKDVEIRLKYHEGKARVKIWTHINVMEVLIKCGSGIQQMVQFKQKKQENF